MPFITAFNWNECSFGWTLNESQHYTPITVELNMRRKADSKNLTNFTVVQWHLVIENKLIRWCHLIAGVTCAPQNLRLTWNITTCVQKNWRTDSRLHMWNLIELKSAKKLWKILNILKFKQWRNKSTCRQRDGFACTVLNSYGLDVWTTFQWAICLYLLGFFCRDFSSIS